MKKLLLFALIAGAASVAQEVRAEMCGYCQRPTPNGRSMVTLFPYKQSNIQQDHANCESQGGTLSPATTPCA